VALGGDPGGAIFGLITAWEGDPEEQPAELNTWMWNELLANDADTLTAFYEKVFGYTSEPGANDYRILKQGDRELAGVAPVPVDLQTSLWLSYIRVADLTGTVSRVTAAGGKILYPMESGRDINQVAILEDTAGAIFGVQQWP
jgi:predicted enzyme related to lactoylglutathione lyase